jgi:hypothetical protein
MNMRKWWPWLVIGGTVVVVLTGYPAYFNWWDHKSCRESGGHWNETQDACIEPKNARFEASGSSTYEDDNQDPK